MTTSTHKVIDGKCTNCRCPTPPYARTCSHCEIAFEGPMGLDRYTAREWTNGAVEPTAEIEESEERPQVWALRLIVGLATALTVLVFGSFAVGVAVGRALP